VRPCLSRIDAAAQHGPQRQRQLLVLLELREAHDRPERPQETASLQQEAVPRQAVLVFAGRDRGIAGQLRIPLPAPAPDVTVKGPLRFEIGLREAESGVE
jgi:hypothetical protein